MLDERKLRKRKTIIKLAGYQIMNNNAFRGSGFNWLCFRNISPVHAHLIGMRLQLIESNEKVGTARTDSHEACGCGIPGIYSFIEPNNNKLNIWSSAVRSVRCGVLGFSIPFAVWVRSPSGAVVPSSSFWSSTAPIQHAQSRRNSIWSLGKWFGDGPLHAGWFDTW